MRRKLLIALAVAAGATAAAPGVAIGHRSPWASVMAGDCGYYPAFHLGAGCTSVPSRPREVVTAQQAAGDFPGPVPRATCDEGSRPETGLQGEVPNADRDSGRSAEGYSCNVEVVGRYRGEGSGWSAAYYKHCAYYATVPTGLQQRRGVVVVDVSDPKRPRFSTTLTSLAMLSPHESLKVNEKRGLLGAVTADVLTMTGVFDVYDIKEDCAHPRRLGTTVNVLGHEGNWAPDGRTYFAAGGTSFLSVVDVSDPRAPRPLTTVLPLGLIHGLGLSGDGNRVYLAHVNPDFLPATFFKTWPGGLTELNGLGVYDVSQIQGRRPNPSARLVGEVNWTDGSSGQQALPFRSGGRPYVLFVDEAGYGGPRIIDVADETRPRIVSKVRLEIQMPEHRARAGASTFGVVPDGRGALAPFGYNSHYCNVDRAEDPRALVCATFEAGIRVFDIRDVRRPREVAYFNPGGDGRRAPGSFAGATSAYTVTQPRVMPDGEIWFTDQDRGLYVIRVSEKVWPADSASRCLPAGTRLGVRGVGPLRVGAPAAAAVAATRRTAYSTRHCVEGRRGRVRAVYSRRGPAGRAVLVATTVRGHALGRVQVGARASAVARAFPRRVRVAPGLHRAAPGSLRLIAVRDGRVRFLAVASRGLMRDHPALRRALRRAGL